MWCTCSAESCPELGAAHGQHSLMPARSTSRRAPTDPLATFPICILSMPTPAFDKFLLLSRSVTLICHFLLNNGIALPTKTTDVAKVIQQDCEALESIVHECLIEVSLQIQIKFPMWSRPAACTVFMMQVAKGQKTCHYTDCRQCLHLDHVTNLL